jgi:hypothetical protein
MSARTTLTLDDDVMARLKAEVRRSGLSFKETVNRLLRRGLDKPEAARELEPFQIKARPLEARPGLNLDDIAELLEQVEGSAHR